MSVKVTQLNKEQLDRLLNHTKDCEMVGARLCEVEGTKIAKFEIYYVNGENESFYPDEDTLDLIMNGIKLERVKA